MTPNRSAVLLLVSLMPACGAPPSNMAPVVVAEASTLSGSVNSKVVRVGLLGASGRMTFAAVQNGNFAAPMPAEPFSVVFYGNGQRLLANLTAKQGGRSVAVFPAPRSKTMRSQSPLEGTRRDGLLAGSDLRLGTITVTATVTVEAQFNFFDDVDTDGDGLSDATDDDDDGDGLPDLQEARHPSDIDGDGTLSLLDSDDDNDGTPDAIDLDDDGDGVADLAEPDTDGDGLADAVDADDDDDGIDDTAEGPDATPDLLVGEWVGRTEVTDFTFATDRAVRLDESFTLSPDGVMSGHFVGADAVSGCDVDYQLTGTWSDAPDAAHRLEVEWTSVTQEVTSCTDGAMNTTGREDVTREEKDIWDDELDGLWLISSNTLTIISPVNAVIASYERDAD